MANKSIKIGGHIRLVDDFVQLKKIKSKKSFLKLNETNFNF